MASKKSFGPAATKEMEREPSPAETPSLSAPDELGPLADTISPGPPGQGERAPCDAAVRVRKEEQNVHPGSEGHKITHVPSVSSKRAAETNEFSALHFPQKLWKLVGSPQFQSIWWSEGEKCVAINEGLFKEEVLGRGGPQRIFGMNSMKSFLRQMNLYGFTKLKRDFPRSASLPEFLAEEAAASAHSQISILLDTRKWTHSSSSVPSLTFGGGKKGEDLKVFLSVRAFTNIFSLYKVLFKGEILQMHLEPLSQWVKEADEGHEQEHCESLPEFCHNSPAVHILWPVRHAPYGPGNKMVAVGETGSSFVKTQVTSINPVPGTANALRPHGMTLLVTSAFLPKPELPTDLGQFPIQRCGQGQLKFCSIQKYCETFKSETLLDFTQLKPLTRSSDQVAEQLKINMDVTKRVALMEREELIQE
ncbi:heat shock transcription y-linked-like [Limosa lapponica baueri]|uniref:Heat shock transcription y-linked-like n=1 Tax=Limosa lapponica baueri TaxID=1758121 RepID=A0A2I0U3G5_LIMLA|nr:heat shock transcription y-linked-like [Limosa lapponica baueri]